MSDAMEVDSNTYLKPSTPFSFYYDLENQSVFQAVVVGSGFGDCYWSLIDLICVYRGDSRAHWAMQFVLSTLKNRFKKYILIFEYRFPRFGVINHRMPLVSQTRMWVVSWKPRKEYRDHMLYGCVQADVCIRGEPVTRAESICIKRSFYRHFEVAGFAYISYQRNVNTSQTFKLIKFDSGRMFWLKYQFNVGAFERL